MYPFNYIYLGREKNGCFLLLQHFCRYTSQSTTKPLTDSTRTTFQYWCSRIFIADLEKERFKEEKALLSVASSTLRRWQVPFAKLDFLVLKLLCSNLKTNSSYPWQILKEQVSMTPKVLSKINQEEKEYHVMGSITVKHGLRCILGAEELW